VLYFSKLRIALVTLVTLFFIVIASSNFQDTESSIISKKINLGLDLQGGSYLLLEIDNGPVEVQKLQNTTTVVRNFLKDKKVVFTDLRIEGKAIFFNISKQDIEKVEDKIAHKGIKAKGPNKNPNKKKEKIISKKTTNKKTKGEKTKKELFLEEVQKAGEKGISMSEIKKCDWNTESLQYYGYVKFYKESGLIFVKDGKSFIKK
jgi:preprotein translocase subunit SecD